MTSPIDTIRAFVADGPHWSEPHKTLALAALTELEQHLAEQKESIRSIVSDSGQVISRATARAVAAEQRANALADALRRVKENAEAWHGPVPEDSGHARALAVIAEWCGAALDRQEQT